MFRRSLCALALGALILTTALGETYLEKVSKVDTDKKTITIPIDKKDTTFKIDPAAVYQTQVKQGKRLNISTLKEGIKGVKPKDDVILTTERKDGEEVVTKIVVVPTNPQPKKKN